MPCAQLNRMRYPLRNTIALTDGPSAPSWPSIRATRAPTKRFLSDFSVMGFASPGVSPVEPSPSVASFVSIQFVDQRARVVDRAAPLVVEPVACLATISIVYLPGPFLAIKTGILERNVLN